MREACMETVRRSAEDVLAPVYVDFVEWILRSAGQKGIRRIYFLARDGYPMYRAAQILSRQNLAGRSGSAERPIELRYLKCSRYALRIPWFHLIGTQAVEQICLGGIDVTLQKVLKRAGLTEEEVCRTARRMGRAGERNRILSRQELQGLREILLRDQQFWEDVSAHARAAYEPAMGYFRQEGLLDDVPAAVADSGWTGSMQQTLGRLLQSGGRKEGLDGYYFGLYHLPEGADPERYHAYYFGPTGNIRRKVWFCNSLFECVFSEPAPMTVGYRKGEQGYEPVPEDPVIRNQEELSILLSAVEARADKSRQPGNLREFRSLRESRNLREFRRLMGAPDSREAEAFGRMKFTDDVLDAGQTLAAPLSEAEIRGNHFLPKIRGLLGIGEPKVIRESAWMEGSIRLAGRRVHMHLLQNRMYRYALYLKKQWTESRKR